MLLWTALLRNLPGQSENFASFNRDGLTGWECEDKTLLVVGVGNIGYEVVKIGQGLGRLNIRMVMLQRVYLFLSFAKCSDTSCG